MITKNLVKILEKIIIDINGQQIYWNDIKEIVIDKNDPFAVKLRTTYVNKDYQTIKINIILFT